MFQDCLIAEIRDFAGPWLRGTQYPSPPANGLLALNCQYGIRGQVGTRFGHSAVVSPGEVARTPFNWLFNWLGAPRNVLLHYCPSSGVRYTDLDNIAQGQSTVISQTGAAGASIAAAGNRVYAGFYNQYGLGSFPGQVYSYGVGADQLFAPPMTVTPTVNQYFAGKVTAGTHRLGYLIQTRNGFTTMPSPASGRTFSPVEFTADGEHAASVTIAATWPSYVSKVSLIMSPTTNLNRYFLVPGGTVAVPGGATWTAMLQADITDADLVSGEDAKKYLDLLTAGTDGTPPFLPGVIYPYGRRMAYVTKDSASIPVTYFSEPDLYQQLTADQHGIYLPGSLPITTGFEQRGAAYIVGPHWTYGVRDNGDVPALWGDPQVVDGSIGTLSPHGVDGNAALGIAFVADVGGLYVFEGGSYRQRPISYYQSPDWQRINWSQPTKVRVLNDPTNKRVSVFAPLDGANEMTHELTWDYTTGLDAEAARYSLNNYDGYLYGGACLFQNPATKRVEKLITPATGSLSIMRANDGTESNPYRDGTKAINSQYETGVIPDLNTGVGQIKFFHGAHLRVQGSGYLSATLQALDHVRFYSSPTVELSPRPGGEIAIRHSLQDEYATLSLGTNALDQYFILSRIREYYTAGPMQR